MKHIKDWNLYSFKDLQEKLYYLKPDGITLERYTAMFLSFARQNTNWQDIKDL